MDVVGKWNISCSNCSASQLQRTTFAHFSCNCVWLKGSWTHESGLQRQRFCIRVSELPTVFRWVEEIHQASPPESHLLLKSVFLVRYKPLLWRRRRNHPANEGFLMLCQKWQLSSRNVLKKHKAAKVIWWETLRDFHLAIRERKNNGKHPQISIHFYCFYSFLKRRLSPWNPSLWAAAATKH